MSDYELENEDKVDLCKKWLARQFKITEETAYNIITKLCIEDKVFEYYDEELRDVAKELDEKAEKDYQYNLEHYNDGWSNHVGV